MAVVKHLVWERVEGEQQAKTPFGVYRFFEKHAAPGQTAALCFSCCEESYWSLSQAPGLTFEQAQLRAQEDFERRVQDCLAPAA